MADDTEPSAPAPTPPPEKPHGPAPAGEAVPAPPSPPRAPSGPLRLRSEPVPTVTLDEETVVETPPPPERPAPPRAEGSLPATPLQTAPGGAETRSRLVRPLRTYGDDISKLVQKGGVSRLSMFTAEYRRQGAGGAAAPASQRRLFIIGSAALMLLGAAAAAFVFFTRSAEPLPQEFAPAPLLFAEARAEVAAAGKNRADLLFAIAAETRSINQPIGSITYLSLSLEPQSGKRLMTASEFLRTVEARVPAAFLRSLEEPFMLGVHEASGNQFFLVLKTTSYGEAFSGMLAWEPHLRRDLAPLSPELAAAAQETAATTTPSDLSIGGDTFRDRLIRNTDTRVLLGAGGAPLLLYALPDQRTIVLTTNETTLGELLSRLAGKPR